MYLGRIHDGKNLEFEETNAGIPLVDLDPAALPPCTGEKVHFLSDRELVRKVNHPYAANQNNAKFYGHYKETTLCYPAHSFAVVPYNWMLKDSKTGESQRASELSLDYDIAREPNLGFENVWVQQLENQRVLLDAFISPIKPEKSLVFIYAKNIPYAENSDRVLIGVGSISKIGSLTEYDYGEASPSSFRSTLWERPVYHTIRKNQNDGFVLPYQQLFEKLESDETINVEEFIAYAPSFEEFSFGSEWVSNDTAIESLLILREKLQRFEKVLADFKCENLFRWIDDQLSRIWEMRGAFPGLGPVLTGLKIKEGNALAWRLDSIIRDPVTGEIKQNPWEYVEKIFAGNTNFLPQGFKVKISDTQKATWKDMSTSEKKFLYLLSRMNVTNDQVKLVIDKAESEQKNYLHNAYLLYERFRLEAISFPFALIDKAIFGNQKLLEQFPLPTSCDVNAELDQRRVRALAVEMMEKSATEGHTLQTESRLVTRLESAAIEPLCNPSIKNLRAIREYLDVEVVRQKFEQEDDDYFKLRRFTDIREKINQFVLKRIEKPISPSINQDWEALLHSHFGKPDSSESPHLLERDIKAKQEKAAALEIMANNRFSILIGPAGTGKTALLELFCQQPFIKNGTVLRLAPTGKARVNMGKEARTLAQFLLETDRYDVKTGLYRCNPDSATVKYDTVILDESSMVTEEQLAALIESLTGVKRFILVGDYRQLPPIGAGKPFVDIVQFLRNRNQGIGELKTLFRQFSGTTKSQDTRDRLDVWLGKWFSDDDIKKDHEDVFDYINQSNAKKWDNIRFEQWESPRHLEDIMGKVMEEELESLAKQGGKSTKNGQVIFDASLGATFPVENVDWASFSIESARSTESWQILSPVNNHGFGTRVINQLIQKKYRGRTKEKAHFPGTWTKDGKTYFNKRKMPKPVGDDGIVYGDKVINLKNTRWDKPWQKVFKPDSVSEEQVLKYIANGEIGLHVGKYGEWKYNSRPINIAFSSQPGYAYTFNELHFKEDGDIKMELAYAITVHKSQGSGFGVVFFILPARSPVLSRELFYTALTRQEDRIVVFHQGDFNDYRRYTSGEFSETGRRLTDLFVKPNLIEANHKMFDTNHVQVSSKGEFMISKSEVVIANALYYKKVNYAYEAAITDEKGVTIHPDFTIETDLGVTYYWEHLGMLSDDGYRSKWNLKKEWYERNGIREHHLDPAADVQLILTRDMPNQGIDSKQIDQLISDLLLG